MCNRYRMTASRADLLARYGVAVDPLGEFERLPQPELFPKRSAWIVRDVAGARTPEPMLWGVPTSVRSKSGKLVEKPVTNVRNLASPFWRAMVARPAARCLVPVTSFSEYGQLRGADGRLPLHWFAVPSRPIFSFAGLWRPTPAGDAFAFLTCAPNSLVAPVHPKAMPVILSDEDEARWLAGDDAAAFQAPFPAQLMARDAPDDVQ